MHNIMQRTYFLSLTIFFISIFLLNLELKAQKKIMPEERASPFAFATYKSDFLYTKVTYGQPFKKERIIFGDLVPYGEVWRTGANEATEITFSREVEIDGNALKAGTYTLFTIPDENEWKIIFNKELGQWGAYSYDETKNVLVVKTDNIESIEDEMYEAMTISFEEAKKGVDLIIMWDQTLVRVPLKFVN